MDAENLRSWNFDLPAQGQIVCVGGLQTRIIFSEFYLEIAKIFLRGVSTIDIDNRHGNNAYKYKYSSQS